jgi:diadenylate cyclase
LLVFPKSATLADLNDPGKPLDAVLSKELLVLIFQKDSRFHDGAAVIRGNRIESVSVTLPISKNQTIDRKYGTRHRAGLGISETSKAMAVILSEETGKISIALDGNLEGVPAIQQVRMKLTEFLLDERQKVTKL